MAAPASPWRSDDSRDFLQERVGFFARTNFLIVAFFFLAGWLIAIDDYGRGRRAAL
jgi:hypothetical protein